MLNSTQIAAMLKLQDAMNAKVNPQWLAAGYAFLRAIVIEGAEAVEHHGWKWWKAQQIDLPQLQMELVDIWHFALSDQLVRCYGDQVRAAREISELGRGSTHVQFDGQNYAACEMTLLEKLDLLIGLAAARRFSIPLFSAILIDCELSWNDLYRQYVGKNVLNFFRQEHGYKAGTYRKIWAGREDNEHLVELFASLDDTADDFGDRLYRGLADRYAETA